MDTNFFSIVIDDLILNGILFLKEAVFLNSKRYMGNLNFVKMGLFHPIVNLSI